MNTVRKTVSSYNYQMFGHIASGFDKYIVLKSLPKSYTSVKISKTRSFLKNEL